MLFVARWPRSYVHSIDLSQIVMVQLTRRTDGTSTLEFPGSYSALSRIGMPSYIRGLPWTSMHHIPPAFEMIADGKMVREHIRQLQAGTTPSATPIAH